MKIKTIDPRADDAGIRITAADLADDDDAPIIRRKRKPKPRRASYRPAVKLAAGAGAVTLAVMLAATCGGILVALAAVVGVFGAGVGVITKRDDRRG